MYSCRAVKYCWENRGTIGKWGFSRTQSSPDLLSLFCYFSSSVTFVGQFIYKQLPLLWIMFTLMLLNLSYMHSALLCLLYVHFNNILVNIHTCELLQLCGSWRKELAMVFFSWRVFFWVRNKQMLVIKINTKDYDFLWLCCHCYFIW